MTYPQDAITIQNIINGAASSTEVISITPSTILGINISQENLASNTDVECNGENILTNFAKTTEFILLNKICNTPVIIKKTGNDKAQIIITYVPYNITLSTSTAAKIYNGFTGGEIVISLLLFWIFSFLIFNFIVEKFIGFFNKRK